MALSSHPFKLADGSEAAVIVEEIITKQKKLQASLVHQEKMAAFGLVAAGVAHEMGNPLSSIEMHLQLLDASTLNEDDAESIATLRKETARLRRTLRELVDFARRRRTTVSSVSVESVVRDALQLLRYDPRMRNIETTVDAGPEIPAVNIVEDHLMQVMVNLLINAIDSMPEGGHLRIDTRLVGDMVAIRVRDEGTGCQSLRWSAASNRSLQPRSPARKELGLSQGSSGKLKRPTEPRFFLVDVVVRREQRGQVLAGAQKRLEASARRVIAGNQHQARFFSNAKLGWDRVTKAGGSSNEDEVTGWQLISVNRSARIELDWLCEDPALFALSVAIEVGDVERLTVVATGTHGRKHARAGESNKLLATDDVVTQPVCATIGVEVAAPSQSSVVESVLVNDTGSIERTQLNAGCRRAS